MTIIILPVQNEEKSIEKTIRNIHKWCTGYFKTKFHILVIDDHSEDETYNNVKDMKLDRVSIYPNHFETGKGSALKSAMSLLNFLYKIKPDDDVVLLDGDGQIQPQEISTLFNVRDLYNSEVVIANKSHDYSNTSYSLQRKIVSRTYNFIVRVLFGFNFRDTQCGLKLFKKYAIDKILGKVTTKQYAFDVELIVASRLSGMRVADAPVKVGRQTNRGSVSFYNIIRTFFDTIIIYINKTRGSYNAD